tara:strand:+ start:246 stop:470 length:225 start_codon:yes stop_codon:yes gene_type:complete
MKEQTLLEMKNKVEATTRVLQQIINELTNLRQMSVGTLETLKLMPEYEEAIEQLKVNMTKKKEEEEEKKKELEL